MKKIYIVAVLLVLGILGIEGVYLAQANNLASESVRVEELKSDISKIEEENQILESEILSNSSLLTISSRAAEMGFEKPREFISLKETDSLALKHE